jgi:hypothetical protein
MQFSSADRPFPDFPHARPSQRAVQVAVPLEPASPEAVAVEVLWAERVGSRRYGIRSIPFEAEDLHLFDEVEVTGGQPGSPRASDAPVVTRVVKRSGHSTYHLLLHVGTETGAFEHVWAPLHGFGCTFEKRNALAIAVDVPPQVPLDRVDKVLLDGERERVWTLEEPSDEHPIAS